jgi:hypothetical protein
VVLLSVLQLLVTAYIRSSLILFTLMMEAIHSSEIWVLTRARWHHITEDWHSPLFEYFRICDVE